MKYAVAGLGASAALAVIALNYQAPEGTQLFRSEILTAEDHEFIRYVSQYGKSYGTRSEFEFRNAQFKEKLAKIADHNSMNEETHTVGLNYMADWTHEEYKKLLGYKGTKTLKVNQTAEVLSEEDINGVVDWRTKGAVTKVKNQGSCGSCWAFSTTGSVEGAMAVAGKGLVSLSEQNLVDCSSKNDACSGGLMDTAFEYIEKNPLMTEADYPYTASKGSCKYVASKGVGTVKAFKDVTVDSSTQLKAALNKGPVSIAIEADQFVFQMYTSGILTSKKCGTKLDHGVLAVGYGDDYYIVKNSWGASWGDAGYLKIGVAEGKGICGIQMDPSYPTE